MSLPRINYTDKERIDKIAEILAEGALMSTDLGNLNPIKGFNFYRQSWERTAESAVIVEIPDDLSAIATN